MQLLYSYLRQYWGLLALALTLATINQVFSLLDPYIFRARSIRCKRWRSTM